MPIGGVRAGYLSTGKDAIPDSGILQYEFEDDSDSSTAVDSFEKGNGGAINGDPQYTTDSKQGSLALDFDGVGDYVDTGITGLTPPFSFAFWVKYQKATSSNRIETFGDGSGRSDDFYFRVDNGSYNLRADNSTDTSINAGNPSQDTWIHIAVTVDSSDVILYETASNIGEMSGFTSSTDTANSIKLGSIGDSIYGDIILDNFSIYGKSLSQSEVQSHKDTDEI